VFDLVTIRVLQGRKTEPGNLALNGSRSCPGACYGTKPWTRNRSFRATDKETPVQTPVQVHFILTLFCGRNGPARAGEPLSSLMATLERGLVPSARCTPSRWGRPCPARRHRCRCRRGTRFREVRAASSARSLIGASVAVWAHPPLLQWQ